MYTFSSYFYNSIAIQLLKKTIKIMFTYKLKFSNGKKFNCTTTTLDACQEKCLPFLINENDSVEILSPTGKKFIIVKRSSADHWNHKGFFFSA